MKVLLELSLKVGNYRESQFNWLRNRNDCCLFIVEDDRVLRTISASRDPGKELNTATLTDNRTCTSVSWNKDLDKMAIVVDKKMIFLWDNTKSDFKHFKPNYRGSNFDGSSMINSSRLRDISLVCWSKVTDKLIVWYSSGQLLICHVNSEAPAKFIDNGYGSPKEIVSGESSDYGDIFVCISIINEIIVMTYEGETKFYTQIENLIPGTIKISPLIANEVWDSNQQSLYQMRSYEGRQSFWLSYKCTNSKIYLKRIGLSNYQESVVSDGVEIILISELELEPHVVSYYWIQSDRLLVCYSTGTVILVKIHPIENSSRLNPAHELTATQKRVLSLPDRQLDEEGSSSISSIEMGSVDLARDEFKAFQLLAHKSKDDPKDFKTYSLAMISDYRVLYYDIIDEGALNLNLEKVDEADLSTSLKKLNLNLERLDWCYDGSMLAVQLSNGHILVYRTKLDEYMVTTFNSRSAYLSGQDEITILNFDTNSLTNDISHLEADSRLPIRDSEQMIKLANLDQRQASILKLNIKPSLIGLGPSHLVAALNNRVQFYSLADNKPIKNEPIVALDEQEYVSIVQGISLSSKFIAVHLSDGRLKLHSIKRPSEDSNASFEERFFPDPSRPETICSFALSEKILVYCTREMNLRVFSLESFMMVQSCNLLDFGLEKPVVRMKFNQLGNMLVCFSNSVYLYDLYCNNIIAFEPNQHLQLFEKMLESQIYYHLPSKNRFYQDPRQRNGSDHIIEPEATVRSVLYDWPDLRKCHDVIWDADGTSLLLLEKKYIHCFAIMKHTLATEDPTIHYVRSMDKPLSYTTLFASHGIISYQTSLGRVINSILASHDDEANLVDLEHKIASIRNAVGESNGDTDLLEYELAILWLKMVYLDSILLLYSLAKCRDICEHLISEEQFNLSMGTGVQGLSHILWRKLAVWALFKLDLRFALIIFRKFGPISLASVLSDIIKDTSVRGSDAKVSLRTRLLIMLNCEI